MEHVYPAGPHSVPADLTKPSAAYRNHAWLAMGGLGLFVTSYFALSSWFTWTAYRLLRTAVVEGEWLWTGVVGLSAGFLAVFMWKALFFVKHRYEIDDIEITAEDQPQLFAFLNRLADEAKAPRAHRVFLSPRVNAAVSYDLSILNLVLPSRKNLEIGLALINVLTLGELKAVLAHEFGHFAQRSMAVGRWVYIAQQIAAHIIAKRDALDGFLRTLSRIDLRIAWVGWLLSLIVWSIRSLMETLFRLVVLAQRALSREMELQADLVAVSLTGSDALIHALHRLQAADDAWERTLNFASAQARAGHTVPDLFAIQQQIIAKLRRVWNQPDYGLVQPLPSERPHEHRVFKAQLAQPPRMWATHPANSEREHNAKRTYIAAPCDDRSAWTLFDDVPGLKQQMTVHVLRHVEAEPITAQEALQKLDEDYNRAWLDPKYQGAYLGRSFVRRAHNLSELYDAPLAAGAVLAALNDIYPPTLSALLEHARALEDERMALQALRDGHATGQSGVIVHRGKQLKARDLTPAIAAVEQESAAVQAQLQAHDRAVRTAHWSAARTLSQGWDAYLEGLLAILHYADHAEANVRDAQGALANVYRVVTADGRVSRKERGRLLVTSHDLFNALQPIYTSEMQQVVLDRTLLRRLRVESWPKTLGEFALEPPSSDDLGSWLGVIDGWVNACTGALGALRLAALEQLLLAEEQVARFVREGMRPGPAPEASKAPPAYVVLLPGHERERQRRLDWWDRFHTADGVVPTLARLAVACGIVAVVVGMGGGVGKTSLKIYNGLGRAVQVTIGDEHAQLPPFGTAALTLTNTNLVVRTSTLDDELIESFEVDAEFGSHYLYNVAGASPLVEWTAVYGTAVRPADRPLGAPRWSRPRADYVFEEPPRSLSGSKYGQGNTRTVLTALGNENPPTVLNLLDMDSERAAMTAAHVRWDTVESRYATWWLYAARRSADLPKLLQQRIEHNPRDILALYAQQEYSEGAAYEQFCARHRTLAAKYSQDVELQYIANRCVADGTERDRQLGELYRRAPNSPWLAMAAGNLYAAAGDWPQATLSLEAALNKLPAYAELIALDLARIRRVSSEDSPTLTDLAQKSDVLQHELSLETDAEASSDVDLAYHHLNRGALETAVATAGHGDSADRVLRLVAASDGASQDIVDRALDMSLERGIDVDSGWAAFALALREHRNLAAYASALRRQGIRDAEFQQVMTFLRAAQKDPQTTDATALLRGLPLEVRGHAYGAACVVLGKRTPTSWRSSAQRLLFVAERPYFARTTA